MGIALKVLSKVVIITGLIVSYWEGWEVLVGSALIFLAIEGAGILLCGILEMAEEKYLDELYRMEYLEDDAT